MSEIYYQKNIKIKLPEAVRFILKALRDAGYEAYAVGGCVRDSILGKEPKDWDITTSAKPFETKALFKRTIDTGIQHGTVTVMIKGEGYEVTTYRVDGEYTDGRHPKEVTFTASLIEDLKRRDFTINAMAYNEEHGVVDCFNGIDDLKNGVIKCVGNAEERFTEDALRMLRAVRFSGVLGFSICEDTLAAIKFLAPTISKISRERIQVELEKLIMSSHPDRINFLYDTELMNFIFPEMVPMPNDYSRSLLADKLNEAPYDHYIRWALFITFANGNINEYDILRSLKFDNATIKICNQLLKYKDEVLSLNQSDLRHIIVKIGKDIFGNYYIPYRKVLASYDEDALNFLKQIEAVYENIKARGDCLSIGELSINGNDIRSLGITEGKQIGAILNMLFELVLNDASLNTKDYLLEYSKEYIHKNKP